MNMAENPSKWLENTVEKGEIARYEQFLLFPQCFKSLVLQTCKNQGLFGKGLSAIDQSAQSIDHTGLDLWIRR